MWLSLLKKEKKSFYHLASPDPSPPLLVQLQPNCQVCISAHFAIVSKSAFSGVKIYFVTEFLFTVSLRLEMLGITLIMGSSVYLMLFGLPQASQKQGVIMQFRVFGV